MASCSEPGQEEEEGEIYQIRERIAYLGDPPLHDEEVRVVNVELDRTEEVLDSVVLDITAVDQVLVLPANDDLSGYGNLVIVLVTQW